MFGHRKGLTWCQVLLHYPSYYLWGREQKGPSKGLVDFLDWVTEYYIVEGNSRDPRAHIEVIQRDIPLSETLLHSHLPGVDVQVSTQLMMTPGMPRERASHCQCSRGPWDICYFVEGYLVYWIPIHAPQARLRLTKTVHEGRAFVNSPEHRRCS